jgi:DNA ligase D-like protein (predicted ligase)/DNA ligase D-like protein (predicted 3'-phosphoesterase)
MDHPMKKRYLPMLAGTADAPFDSDKWLFEIKWDGIRAIAYIDKGLSIRSRNDREIGGQFPELAELLELAPGTVIDGEIIVMTAGRPDIQAVLPRLQAGSGRLQAPSAGAPVTYIVFDILEEDGKPVISLPLSRRRKILEERVKEGDHVVLSVPVMDRGVDYYQAAIEKGLEGVMAKRKNSLYEPGTRSTSWLKIKSLKTCDCVIAGYTPGEGNRSSWFGALLLGLYKPVATGQGTGKKAEKSVQLVYIGKVGTGFSDRDLSGLKDSFTKITRGTPQITGIEKPGRAVWLEPQLVCEIVYQALTRDNRLRMPRFIRMRPDKTPAECTFDQLRDLHISGTGLIPGRKKQAGDEKNSIPDRKPGGPDNLEEYRSKRNFSVTREPWGEQRMAETGNYFVVHEHHARHLHYDLRLERDGVLKSWAVPKGIPESPGQKHLAVAVEDHPLDYGHFEGTIPEGEYGAGTVSIWDNGTYQVKQWDEQKIEVIFHGKRLDGLYVLVRFKRAGKDEWLIFKSGGG